MPLRSLILAAVLLSAAGFALWKWRESHLAAARRAEAWEEQRQIAATESVLDRRVEFTGQSVSLETLAQLLGDVGKLPVEIDRQAIEVEHSQVSSVLVDVPDGEFSLRAGLSIALAPHDLCCDIRAGRLVLTSFAASHDHNALRAAVYPLPEPLPPVLEAEDWAGMVERVIEPNDWKYVGGRGHVEPVPGALVIAHTPAVHRQIRRLLAALAGGEGVPSGEGPRLLLGTGPIERRIQQALNELSSLDCVELPLSNVVAQLARQHAIPIRLHSKQLRAAGVSSDVPVTCHLTGVSLRSVLQMVLGDLELSHTIADECLVVTTPEDAEVRFTAIAFPVRDLVNSPGQHTASRLIELIDTCVAPESWDSVGGYGRLFAWGEGELLVVQTPHVQQQVERLLAGLRRGLAGDGPIHVAEPSPQELRIRAALDRQMPLRFVEEPLTSARDRLKKELQIPIFFHAKRLQDAGIPLDVRLNCDLPAGPISGRLRLCLEQLDLTYRIRDEAVVITTPNDNYADLSLRLYDVRSLLDPDLGVTDADGLLDLVTTLIRPEDWVDVGGPASIKEFQGLLVVSADDDTHQQLNRLLSGLKSHCLRMVKPGIESPAVVKFDATAGEAAIESALAKTIDVELNDVTLEAALKSLAAEHRLPLVLDWRRIEEAGISLEQSVSLQLRGITLRSALRQILDPVELTFWRIRDDLLQVTTDETSHELPIVAYRMDDFGGRRGGEYDEVTEIITTAIVPEDWVDVGGTGAIQWIDGWLVVAQEHAVHDQIDRLLAQLRRMLNAEGGPAAFDVSPPTPMDERIQAALQKDLPFDFVNRPLAEVVRTIGARCGIPVMLQDKKLEEAGISAERPVTCYLEAAPLASQLRLLLEPLELTFVNRHESLLITTREDAEDIERLPIRIYDARRLVEPTSGIGTADELLEHVQSLIAPDSWTDTGGPGSISDFRGLLIVSQTEEVHEQLAALAEHALGEFVPPPDWQGFVDVRPSRAEQRIEAMLAEPVDVDFCGEPLEQALSRLADRYDFPLVIDPRSTEWELWPQQLVTYSARGQRLSHVLDRLLLPHGMTYDVRHNVLLICAVDEVHQPCEMRLYHTAGVPLTDTSDSWPLPNHFMPQIGGDEWGTEGSAAHLRRITSDWLAVIAPIRAHHRIADRLAELRTGVLPPRELAQRPLARELEIMSRHPEPRVYGREWDRATAEDPFR